MSAASTIVPDSRKQCPRGRIRDLIEFPAQGRGRGFGVLAGGFDVLVAEKALHIMSVPSHNSFVAIVWRSRCG